RGGWGRCSELGAEGRARASSEESILRTSPLLCVPPPAALPRVDRPAWGAVSRRWRVGKLNLYRDAGAEHVEKTRDVVDGLGGNGLALAHHEAQARFGAAQGIERCRRREIHDRQRLVFAHHLGRDEAFERD